MAKYVDVEKVFCADCEDRDRCGSPDVFCYVHSMPAADVAPVVHGRWLLDDYTKRYRCSVCEAYQPYDAVGDYISYWDCDFCPLCGAKMDGERKGDDER